MGKILDAMTMLVRYALCGREIDASVINGIISSDDYGHLYSLATHHDMAHLLGFALSELGLLSDDEISKKFRKAYFVSHHRYLGIEYELNEVKGLLSSEGIVHVPLKGSVIRGYYKEGWMRTSCDIDVLVHKEDIEPAVALLTERLGYTVEKKSFHDVSLFSKGGVNLELHFSLIESSNYKSVVALLGEVWNYAHPSGEGATYILSDDFFYFYHVAHMLKHFVNGGCGVRSFVDLWILDNIQGSDKEGREKLLSSVGIDEFARRSSHLAAIWMQGLSSDEFYDKLARLVIAGGVYGEEGQSVLIQSTRRGSKFKYLMSRIFMPYEPLSRIFPVLKKHKWLTPVFEVVRWFKLIFGGRLRYSIDEIKHNASIDEDTAKEAESVLSTLGILDNK